MSNQSKIRLLVEQPLASDAIHQLTAHQSHYLTRVMRLSKGECFRAFNSEHGEWQARLIDISKTESSIQIEHKLREADVTPDIHLYFGPLKKNRTQFLVEKATEIGVKKLCPILTDYTNTHRVNIAKLHAVACEATEQCEGFHTPEILPFEKLSLVLNQWGNGRALIFCDEEMPHKITPLPKAPAAIFIGPEGGFSPQERAVFKAMKEAHSISLGSKILRAETAAIVALTYWHSTVGGWV